MPTKPLDVVLLHRAADNMPALSVHLIVDGERRVITQPIEHGTLLRLLSDGAKLIAEDLAQVG